MKAKRQETIDKLKAKKAALEARLRQEYGRERANQRKADTRRKILAGAAVLSEAEARPEFNAQLQKLLQRFLTKPEDRALFNLPTTVSDRPASAPGDTPDEMPAMATSGFGASDRQAARH